MQNKILIPMHKEAGTGKPTCQFEGELTENLACARGISPYGRNDSKVYYNANNVHSVASVNIKSLQAAFLILLMVFVFYFESSAQNTMQINNAQGLTNDTIAVSLAITNEDEFISFQCDISLPEGFEYVEGSMTLSTRSVDHVVNVTDIGNRTLRVLSYSLYNTAFLSDSGTVASLLLTTPPLSGNYTIRLKNGIIGSTGSVNILDSLVPGTIKLNPLAVEGNSFSLNNIQCYPNPFRQVLTVKLEIDNTQSAVLEVFDIKGVLLSSHHLKLNQTGINEFVFQVQNLLGNTPASGIYFLHFSFQHENQRYSLIKRAQFQQ